MRLSSHVLITLTLRMSTFCSYDLTALYRWFYYYYYY